MTTTSVEKVRALPQQSLWDLLTKPSDELRAEDKFKARLLAGMLVVFLPLSIITDFYRPVSDLLKGQQPLLPDFGTSTSLGLIVVSYILSRTRYYSAGGWAVALAPIFAILGSILTHSGQASIVSLYFLSLSIVIAGLLLTSRDTLVIGLLVTAIPLVLPPVASTPELQIQEPNWTATMFALLVTGITVLVGRIRENNFLALEKSQASLAQSLRETEEARICAERSDNVKSAFLASMSHELRTPLNAIINFTEFILDGDTGEINEEQRSLLAEVASGGKHLLALINDVLDMSKIEAGSLNLFVEDNIDISSLLNNAVSTCRSLLQENVQLTIALEDNLPLIRADRQRIVQIMLNVLSNACKFTEQGEIRVSARQDNGKILIAVADTGPGIRPEDQAAVFEAFKQTDAGLRQGGGTGLGMPISKSLAEAHAGQLWLDSAPGKGTTFYISLPIRSEKLKPIVTFTNTLARK